MTDRKKEYITDALGEIEDIFIAEAAEYVKPAFRWKYWRECGAVAACICAIVITATAWQFLPISPKTSVENTAVKTETRKEEMAPESTLEEMAPESTLKETVSESTDVEVKQEKESAVSKPVGDVVFETESIAEYLSAEDILAEGHDIFLGEVTQKQVLQMKEGRYHYFTVITVRVEDSIRGDIKAGEEYRIYLPVAVTETIAQAHSLSGDLNKLSVGSRAVFMPKRAVDSGFTDAEIDYSDYADYYYQEGLRYLFLETLEGVSYAEEVYDVGVDGAGTVALEDVVTYLKQMLSGK